jgi:signal transduction histidine kinase
MVDEHRRQLGADFCIVTDRGGRRTAASGWPAGAAENALSASIAEATAGRKSRSLVALRLRDNVTGASAGAAALFLLVSEPARFADEILGTLTVGYALNDAVAVRLAEVTHSHVSLVVSGQLSASSLPRADRVALAGLAVANGGDLRDGVSRDVQHVGDGAYLVGSFPLSLEGPGPSVGRLILLQDWKPTGLFLGEIQRQIFATGAVVFALSMGAGWLFTRRVTRPLQDLADAAGDIAGGNWDRQVPIRGGVESVMMARAFNNMTSSLRHWRREVRERDDRLRQAQKMEAIGRLAGGVAHDFNNVLTAIKGYGELLAESIEANDPRRQDADEILKAAERAANLTKQLLAFSRRGIVSPRVLALDQVVKDTEHMLRRLIGEDIELTTAIGPAIGFIRADASQIEQVLLNLVVNARDAMAEGGTLGIEVANTTLDELAAVRSHLPLQPGPYVRLSVADSGCGMSEETVAHIFEPFFTTKKEGEGTGLGLATVYGIVEQTGAAIDIDTEIGRGTTFHVYFPQTEGDAACAAATPPAAPVVRAWETVLLVEDDHSVRTLIASGLQKAGYTVLEASDSATALQIAEACASRIHLLLTDVVMPGINGRELADRLCGAHRDLRVIFMSGYSDDAILRRGVQTSSADFIQKPFSMDTLTARVQQTLLEPA